MSFRRQLPSLSALMAFEAAGRLVSFTKAAAEMGVTQAAVSRQIHALEEDLGTDLFLRVQRGVRLTPEGSALLAATRAGFEAILDGVREIRARTEPQELTIHATVAVSHFWLMPRISEFTRQNPDIRLRITAQDNRDAFRNDADVILRYCNGTAPEGEAQFLFRDEVFPVCSPSYAAEHGTPLSLQDLTARPLISHRHSEPNWLTWDDWLGRFAMLAPRQSGMVCSSYTDAIYACIEGQGIALGWDRMVSDFLAQGRLIRLTDASVRTTDAYYVIAPDRKHPNPSTGLLVEWLLNKAAARPLR